MINKTYHKIGSKFEDPSYLSEHPASGQPKSIHSIQQANAGKDYHFSDSKTSTSLDEPAYLTKFVSTWILPPALRSTYGTQLISEQLKKVGGLDVDKMLNPVEQFYRFHKRRFAGSITETNIDVTTSFEVNVSKGLILYPYNVVREWLYLIYDPQTGFQGLKRDYVGSWNLEIHNKVGDVLRTYYFPIFFPIKPITSMNLDYSTEGIYRMDMTWAGENWTDKTVRGDVG